MTNTDPNLVALAADPACAITHLCKFLRERNLYLHDFSNYTQSLPFPSNDPAKILNAVAACGDAHLLIVNTFNIKVGWVYLILPPAVGPAESVADYGMNDLTEAWAEAFDAARA